MTLIGLGPQKMSISTDPMSLHGSEKDLTNTIIVVMQLQDDCERNNKVRTCLK